MIIVLPRYNVTSYLSARISNHLTEFRKIIKNARTSRHRIPTQARQIITRIIFNENDQTVAQTDPESYYPVTDKERHALIHTPLMREI